MKTYIPLYTLLTLAVYTIIFTGSCSNSEGRRPESQWLDQISPISETYLKSSDDSKQIEPKPTGTSHINKKTNDSGIKHPVKNKQELTNLTNTLIAIEKLIFSEGIPLDSEDVSIKALSKHSDFGYPIFGPDIYQFIEIDVKSDVSLESLEFSIPNQWVEFMAVETTDIVVYRWVNDTWVKPNTYLQEEIESTTRYHTSVNDNADSYLLIITHKEHPEIFNFEDSKNENEFSTLPKRLIKN